MISKDLAVDRARALTSINRLFWHENDIQVEWREKRLPSKSWFMRRFFESATGFPACWLVRVGKPPEAGDWINEDRGAAFSGEGCGYLFNAETGEFMGVDTGFHIISKEKMLPRLREFEER